MSSPFRLECKVISIEATAIRWLGQAAIPKTTHADLLVSDGLLTQPGGFEGFVTVQELVPANDLVIAQERYRPALHGDLDAAALAPPFKGLSGDDMVAPNQELRRFDLERVPGVQPTLEVTAHRIEPVERLRLFERQVLHVVVEALHDSVQVAAVYRLVELAQASDHLLFRHRPRSIPLAASHVLAVRGNRGELVSHHAVESS